MKQQMVKVDRTKLNLKAISISDYDSEEYEVLLKVINKTLELERKTNQPIMDVQIKKSDAAKLFPEFETAKKVLV